MRSTLNLVHPKGKQGLFNFQCFDNAVQWVVEHPEYAVSEVIYLDEEYPILHYVNSKKGKLYETTLGYRTPQLEYYVIREIDVADYPNIRKEFNRSMSYWTKKYTNWFDRKVLRISRIL